MEVPIIIADVNDEDSLAEMSQQANVVINCVGPVSDETQCVILY